MTTSAEPNHTRPKLAFVADTFVVVLLAVVAYRARADALRPSSLWHDDAWVAVGVRVPWPDVLEVGLTAPGFVALVRLVTAAFGRSTFVFQLVPMLAGTALAPVTYLSLSRRVRRSAAGSVGLLVIWAPANVDYSARVKQYTLDSLVSLVLLLLALALLDDDPDDKTARRRWWAWFTATSIVAITLSSVLAVVVASCCIVLGLSALRSTDRRRALRSSLPWFTMLGVFTVIYYLTVIRAAMSDALAAYWKDSYLSFDDGLVTAFKTTVSQTSLLLEQMFAVRPVGALLVILVLATLIVGRNRPLAALLFILPVLLTIALAFLELAPYGGGRVDSHLLPGLLLTLAFGLHHFLDTIERRGSATVALMAASLIALGASGWVLANQRPQAPYPIEDIRPLVEIVNTQRTPNEPLLVYYASTWAFALYTTADVSVVPYDDYLDLTIYNVGFDDPNITVLGRRRQAPDEYREWVDQVTASGEPVWFISSHPFPGEIDIINTMFQDSGYVLTKQNDAPSAHLEYWSPR